MGKEYWQDPPRWDSTRLVIVVDTHYPEDFHVGQVLERNNTSCADWAEEMGTVVSVRMAKGNE